MELIISITAVVGGSCSAFALQGSGGKQKWIGF